jgi:hypothetical protein
VNSRSDANLGAESAMRHHRFVVALLVLASQATTVLAAEIEIPPRRGHDNVSVHKGPPNCSRWTDGCVNCSRDDKDAEPICSNIGIACQPKAVACLSRASSPKP